MDARITVHYQPIVDLNDPERVVGVEALARPDGAPPTQEMLDEFGCDHEKAADVSAEVCVQAFDLLAVLPGDIYVSVNLPPQVLGSGLLRDRVPFPEQDRDRLERFVVEVTERHELHSKAWDAAEQAKALGMSLAIDDFGMGRNGLTQLLAVDFDIIKIDKTFVDRLRGLGDGEHATQDQKKKRRNAERVIRAIAALARSMRTHSVAEGIERPEQAAILRAMGVDYGQGWLWHKAMPRDDLLAMLAARHPVA